MRFSKWAPRKFCSTPGHLVGGRTRTSTVQMRNCASDCHLAFNGEWATTTAAANGGCRYARLPGTQGDRRGRLDTWFEADSGCRHLRAPRTLGRRFSLWAKRRNWPGYLCPVRAPYGHIPRRLPGRSRTPLLPGCRPRTGLNAWRSASKPESHIYPHLERILNWAALPRPCGVRTSHKSHQRHGTVLGRHV
jgi:hypothetical protein